MADQTDHTVQIKGQAVPLRVRRHARAKNMVLRVEPDGGAVLTLPTRVSVSDGKEFVQERASWVMAQLDALPEQVPFAEGAQIPLFGEMHTLSHRNTQPRTVMQQGDTIFVSGKVEHFSRRVQDWLRKRAREEITARAYAKAKQLDVRISRVTLRDTRSRWGSCAVGGRLSFSWRLIMAPEYVLDYVVAHEVSHILHHNHGPAFWQAVGQLTKEMDNAKLWLRENGESLHCYGV